MKAMACRPEGDVGAGWAESDDAGLAMRRESRTVQARVGGHSWCGQTPASGRGEQPVRPGREVGKTTHGSLAHWDPGSDLIRWSGVSGAEGAS